MICFINVDSLIIIGETFTNGYKAEFIYIISLASVLSGIFVIISRNPIVSVLFLIGLFLSIACYLMVLGMNFIGLSYLLVYVGAVSILFLFILMLINVRISELSNDTSNSMPLALVIAISFNYPVYQILPLNFLNIDGYSVNLDNNLTDYLKSYVSDYTVKNYTDGYITGFFNSFNIDDGLLFVTSNFWDGSIVEAAHITSIGSIMYTSYSIWLVITSTILLLAMVGAIVITIKQKD